MRDVKARDYTSATDTQTHSAATALIAANANTAFRVMSCGYSYSAAPTGGKLQIKAGSTVIWEQDVTAAGPATIYPAGLTATLNQALSAVLADGGSGIVGKVNLTAELIPG